MEKKNSIIDFFSQKSVVKRIIGLFDKGDAGEVDDLEAGSLSNKLYLFIRKLRNGFASFCERSVLSIFFDNLYYSLLSVPLKAVGLYLAVFSIFSFGASYLAERDLYAALFHDATFMLLCTLLISFFFFTANSSLGKALFESKLFSTLDVVHSGDSKFIKCSEKIKTSGVYSTALFLGIISAVATYILSPISVILFVICLVYAVFVFNRPECGILLCISLCFFFPTVYLLCFILLTLIAFLYKYLRGKRHIGLGKSQILVILLAVSVFFSSFYNSTGKTDSVTCVKLIIIISLGFLAVNILRSTAILNKAVSLFADCCGAISTILVLNLLLVLFTSKGVVSAVYSSEIIGFILKASTSRQFVSPFLVISIPLVMSLSIGAKKHTDRFKRFVQLILLLLCLIYSFDFSTLFSVLIAVTTVLTLYHKAFSVLYIVSPVISQLLVKLYSMFAGKLPEALIFRTESVINNEFLITCANIFKKNPIFGIGIGTDNFHTILIENGFVNASSVSNTGSLMFDILLKFGVFGLLLVLTVIFVFSFKNIKFNIFIGYKDKNIKAVSTGTFASTVSFLILSIYKYTITDSRILAMFVFITAIGYSLKHCHESDYIDESYIREYQNS